MKSKAAKESSAQSDAFLLTEIAKKETGALSGLYERYSARLYGLALKILKDESLAQDVVQDIFLKVWQNADKFEKSRGSAIAWLMILCRNRSIDKLRQREKSTKRSAVFNEELNIATSFFENPLETVEQNELQKTMTNALSQLPQEQRTAIEMAFYQGFSQSEISDELKVPLGTIKTRIRLGMQKLRDFLIKSR